MEGSQIWFYCSIIFLDPCLDLSPKLVLKTQVPFSQASLFLKVMWADFQISYCVFNQAVTWINKGTSCISFHNVKARWAGQRGMPQAWHDKSQFGHLENYPFELTLLVCPTGSGSCLLSTSVLRLDTWHQSALAETRSYRHNIKSKRYRSIFSSLQKLGKTTN